MLTKSQIRGEAGAQLNYDELGCMTTMPSGHRILCCTMYHSEALSHRWRWIAIALVGFGPMGVRVSVGISCAFYLWFRNVSGGAEIQLRLRLPTTCQEHSYLPTLCHSLRDLIPIWSNRYTAFQGRENVDHSIHHGFKTRSIEGEWYFADKQT